MAKEKPEKEMMMDWSGMMIAKMIITFVIVMVLIWAFWMWIMPDVFPTGIVAGTISIYTAFKITLVMALCIISKKMMKKRMMMMHDEKWKE